MSLLSLFETQDFGQRKKLKDKNLRGRQRPENLGQMQRLTQYSRMDISNNLTEDNVAAGQLITFWVAKP